jgi:hypothetical protein
MTRPINFNREIERINDRIDITDPSREDLLALAEACRWASVVYDEAGHARPASPAKAGHHFFANYGTKRLKLMAEDYAAAYDGDFEFMVEMKTVVRQRGYLSMKQAAGVLNVMLNTVTRAARRTGDLPAALARVA